MATIDLTREPIPFAAACLAGKAHALCRRRRGGLTLSPLPDFFTGAHAAVAGYRLLTCDPRRFRTYFPRLRLIAPRRPSLSHPPPNRWASRGAAAPNFSLSLRRKWRKACTSSLG